MRLIYSINQADEPVRGIVAVEVKSNPLYIVQERKPFLGNWNFLKTFKRIVES
jgi:hypothetical protein